MNFVNYVRKDIKIKKENCPCPPDLDDFHLLDKLQNGV